MSGLTHVLVGACFCPHPPRHHCQDELAGLRRQVQVLTDKAVEREGYVCSLQEIIAALRAQVSNYPILRSSGKAWSW
jgi:hypothetical protein